MYLTTTFLKKKIGNYPFSPKKLCSKAFSTELTSCTSRQHVLERGTQHCSPRANRKSGTVTGKQCKTQWRGSRVTYLRSTEHFGWSQMSSGLTQTIIPKGSEHDSFSCWAMISVIVRSLLFPRKQSREGHVILFGLHRIYQCPYCVKCVGCSVVLDSLGPHGLQPCQAPLSMEFSRQEYWSGLPFPSPM